MWEQFRDTFWETRVPSFPNFEKSICPTLGIDQISERLSGAMNILREINQISDRLSGPMNIWGLKKKMFSLSNVFFLNNRVFS